VKARESAGVAAASTAPSLSMRVAVVCDGGDGGR
jgi:hypothetical protein